MKKIILLLLTGLMIAGCKKEDFELPEESTDTSPIFKIRGSIGGHHVDMQAGVDGAYLETFIATVNEIDFFSGEMTKGSELFSLSVSNGNIGLTPTPTDVFPTSISFVKPSNSWFSVAHQNLSNAQQIQSITFSVDGFPTGDSVNIVSSGYHTVCANIVFFDGSSHSICNKLLLGYKDHGSFIIKHQNQSGSATNIWIESPSSISSIKWYINNQYFSDITQIALNSGEGIITAKAVVTFSNGITREHSVLIDTEGAGRNFSDMEIYKTQVQPDSFNDFKISLTYQNDTSIFSGYATPEIPGSFTVSSVSLFKKKNNGNKIYKVSGIINGQLLDLLSGVLLPSQLEITFAIELPY
jgi:hypothetical protein